MRVSPDTPAAALIPESSCPHPHGPSPAESRSRAPMSAPRELELVTQVLRSDVLAMGPFAPRFEAAIAALAGRREGIACSSGTAGLHLGVRALGIGEGDEVITTPFSFVASANCLLYERAVPAVRRHRGGQPRDRPGPRRAGCHARGPGPSCPSTCSAARAGSSQLEAIARRRGWNVIEDACEGLGSSVGGRPLGSFGDVAVFAFYPNKQITTGEGGMVVTDDPPSPTIMRSLRNQGRDTDGTWLRHVRLGYNYRLDELSAAVGVAQVERLAELRAGRARVVAAYERALGGDDWVRLPRAGAGEACRLVRLRRPARRTGSTATG